MSQNFIDTTRDKDKDDLFATHLALTCGKEFLELYALFDDEFFAFLNLFANNEIDLPSVQYLRTLQLEMNVYVESLEKDIDGIAEELELPKQRVEQILERAKKKVEKHDIEDIDVDGSQYKMAFEEFNDKQLNP